MDYQGQNVNPNLTPDMGQNVAAPNILETPDLSHDVQGMGAIGSSAAKDAVEQMMKESLADQDNKTDDRVIDLLNERPPLSPDEMPEPPIQSGEIEEALKTPDAMEGAQELAVKEVMHGDTISSEMAARMDKAIDNAGKAPADFNDEAFKMIDEMVAKIRGDGIGRK